jgi:dihydroorotase
LIDVHVHLREPGQEWKETVATGTAAAAAGGFTTIFCMPNTEPALDSVVMLEELRRRTERDAVIAVHPIAAISAGRRGKEAADFDALARAGAVGFSDDGESTRDASVMREALRASRRLGVPVMVHCEEPTLAGGSVHDGDVSQQLGLRGLPAAAEEIVIGRDIALAEETGGWLHVCHVSTGRGADMVAAARGRGVAVTAEVMPHHLLMTDGWVVGCRTLAGGSAGCEADGKRADADTKVNPPLRSQADADRLLQATVTGEIDLVATDHAPHGRPEKEGRGFENAAFGLIGSEVALPLMLELTRRGDLSLGDIVRLMSTTPARLWGIGRGTLRPGKLADIVVFDPDERWRVTAERLISRSANTPLLNMALRGRVKLTLCAGNERFRDW